MTQPELRPVTRREVVRTLGLASVGLAVAPLEAWPASWFRQDESVVPFTDIPDEFPGFRRRMGGGELPGQNLRAQDLRELTSWVTPADEFFTVAHYNYPELDAAGYTLEVDGLVDTPLALDLDDLKARPPVERTTVFECSGNSSAIFHGMVGNARWTGVDLLSILEEADLEYRADEIHFWAADKGTEEIRGQEYEQNFARSMSMEQIEERRPILAYAMNGEPLPAVHGYPVRLVVPGWYGICQVKWLQRIEASADRLMTRFMARDYVTLKGEEVDGEVEWKETSVTRQRVKSVIARVTRRDERFTIFGAAWTDGTPLDRVEVQVDGGEWRRAELDRQGNPHAWTFFSAEVEGLEPGEHEIVSRATDRLGRTQPESLELKRTRWENNELFYRSIRVS